MRLLVGTPTATPAATALRAASSALRTLETRARLLGNAHACRRLSLDERLRFGVFFFVAFFAAFAVLFFVAFALPFHVLLALAFAVFRFGAFLLLGRTLGGHGFVVHFVGKGVGILGRAFLIFFAIAFLIGVQRFLQLLEFRGLDKRFGHGFDRLGPIFGVGRRFFVLGLGQLFGERGYIFVGECRAVRGLLFGDLSVTRGLRFLRS
jgi:hypothetical protein